MPKPDESSLERFIGVMQAELDRLRADYNVTIVYARRASADYEHKCKRCGLWIFLGTPVILVERSNRTDKAWVHEVCPSTTAGA